MTVACPLCGTRKAKRYCAARGDNICTVCCAENREATIECPYECVYLRESRLHRRQEFDRGQIPHPDVQVTEEILQRADVTLILLSAFLSKALRSVPNAVDRDAREALEALIQSSRAARSGLVYDAMPENALAAQISQRFRESLAGLTREMKDREGASSVFSEAILLGILVFLARVAHGHDNGRPKCRAFLHYLKDAFPEDAPDLAPRIESSIAAP